MKNLMIMNLLQKVSLNQMKKNMCMADIKRLSLVREVEAEAEEEEGMRKTLQVMMKDIKGKKLIRVSFKNLKNIGNTSVKRNIKEAIQKITRGQSSKEICC